MNSMTNKYEKEKHMLRWNLNYIKVVNTALL